MFVLDSLSCFQKAVMSKKITYGGKKKERGRRQSKKINEVV